MAAKVWHAKESVVKLGLATSVNITAGTVLDTAFSATSAITGVMKDITVTEPMGDIEKIDLLGTDSNGFQNAEVEEKPAGLVEVSGTLILPGDEEAEQFLYDAGTATTNGTGWTTYRAGKASRRKLAILLNLDDGTDEVNYAGTNMYPTARDAKVTGADGHYETTFTVKGLPRDWFGPQFKN
jgi:hypothetical protein